MAASNSVLAGKVMTIPARTGHDRVCSGSESRAYIRPERDGGEALTAAFNIGLSHQQAEDHPQEPIEAWLDVMRITVSPISPNFTKSTLPSRLLPRLLSITSRWLSACIP